jgi:hypothetical protein
MQPALALGFGGLELVRTRERRQPQRPRARGLDGERGPYRALCIVLEGLWITKERHQPVSELLQHMAAKIGHRLGNRVKIWPPHLRGWRGIAGPSRSRGPAIRTWRLRGTL